MAHIIEVKLRYECTGNIEECKAALKQQYAPYQGRTESFSSHGYNGNCCGDAEVIVIEQDESYTAD